MTFCGLAGYLESDVPRGVRRRGGPGAPGGVSGGQRRRRAGAPRAGRLVPRAAPAAGLGRRRVPPRRRALRPHAAGDRAGGHAAGGAGGRGPARAGTQPGGPAGGARRLRAGPAGGGRPRPGAAPGSRRKGRSRPPAGSSRGSAGSSRSGGWSRSPARRRRGSRRRPPTSGGTRRTSTSPGRTTATCRRSTTSRRRTPSWSRGRAGAVHPERGGPPVRHHPRGLAGPFPAVPPLEPGGVGAGAAVRDLRLRRGVGPLLGGDDVGGRLRRRRPLSPHRPAPERAAAQRPLPRGPRAPRRHDDAGGGRADVPRGGAPGPRQRPPAGRPRRLRSWLSQLHAGQADGPQAARRLDRARAVAGRRGGSSTTASSPTAGRRCRWCARRCWGRWGRCCNYSPFNSSRYCPATYPARHAWRSSPRAAS